MRSSSHVAVRLAAAALLAAIGSAHAATTPAPCSAADSTLAACSDADVEAATARLSQQYAQLWAKLPATERAAFKAREKTWLTSGRWQEKDACVAEQATSGPAIERACLVQVTERRASFVAGGAAQ